MMLQFSIKKFLIFIFITYCNIFTLINGFPINQLNCDFDNYQSLCNWDPLIANYHSDWKWIKSNVRSINYTGPFDSPVNKNGYFIQTYVRSTSMFSVTGALQSPIIDPTQVVTCFQFYYYIHGVDVGSIELHLISGLNDNVIWMRKYPAGDMWHLYMINISPQNTQFKLKFVVYSGGGAVAFDNFMTMNNQCPTNGICDFESGLCDWVIQNNTQIPYKFRLIQAQNDERQGVMIDHSTQSVYGHFIQAYSGRANDMAMIVSKQYNVNYGQQCFQFWYWREKSMKNKLDVILVEANKTSVNNAIWTSNLTFPTQTWHRASVSITFTALQNIVIRATHLDTQPIYSPINIDDISIKPGICSPPITCDFNLDLCGFLKVYNPSITEWIWDHGFGRVEYSSKLNFIDPPRDRNAPINGMFMYTDFTGMASGTTFTMKLDSEYVRPTSASCLTFYYLVMNLDETKNSFNVIALNSSDYTIKTLWTYSKQNDSNANTLVKSWLPIHIPIQSAQEFKISFRVKSTNASTYLALDDVSYRSGVCGIVSPTGPPLKTTLTPVSPALDLSCNFESGNACNWKLDALSVWKLNNINAELQQMMPTVDHTKQRPDGRYVYMLSTVGSATAVGQITAIDNAIANYKGPICVSLWYYMRTYSTSKFDFIIKTPTDQVVQQISRFNDNGEKWNLLRFDANELSNGYKFIISASVSNGIVAIDDIVVNHQACDQLRTDVFQCTFEEGHNCGILPLYSATYANWRIYKGSDTFIKTNDHTLKTLNGHFYSIDFSGLNSPGVTYNYGIASQTFPPTKGSCVTFSYYMRGLSNNERLEFYLKPENVESLTSVKALWSVIGEQGPFWHSYRTTIVSSLSWKIAFSAVALSTKDGLIAIDDVIVEIDKPCPPTGICDFENGDTCMWESILPTQNSITQQQKLRWSNISIGLDVQNNIVMKTDFTWTVHSPIHGSSTIYPPVDHTLNQRAGNYLLLRAEQPRKLYDRSVIMSERFDIIPKNRAFCLKLFYYVKNLEQYFVYSKLEVYQSENYKTTKKIYQIYATYNQNLNWVPLNITVKPENLNSTNMWFYLVGTVGTLGSYIAIDDISINSGECVVPSQMFNCSQTEWIPKSKVCDYVNDCSNGNDERVCGSCDFEDSLRNACGYSPTFIGNQNDGNIYQWRYGTYLTGPKIGASGSSSYLIARRLGPTLNEPSGQTDLQSPQINGAASGCYVNFKYNIYGVRPINSGSVPLSHLSVLLNRNGFEQIEIWNSDAMNVQQGRWLNGFAYLRRMNYNYSITFRAIDNGQQTDSYVALDDIVFAGMCRLPPKVSFCPPTSSFQCSNGACISRYYTCDYEDNCGDNSDELICNNFKYKCDFENGFCNWRSNGGWILRNGAQKLLGGPTRDHTKGISSGRLMYLSNTNIEATLEGPIFQPDNGCYITYWVDIEGTATLTLIAQNMVTGFSTTIVSYSDPSGMFYFTRHVALFTTQRQPFKVIFKGTVNQNKNQTFPSYIALDDISFSPQCSPPNVIQTLPPIVTTPSPCKVNEFACTGRSEDCIDKSKVCDFMEDCGNAEDEKHCGSCSFDKNSMCGWTNIGNGKQQWSLQPASKFASLPNTIPKADSKGNKTASFLIIDTSKGGTYDTPAIITTPPLGKTGPNCVMSFDFHHTNPESDSFLYVFIHRVRDSFEKTIASLNMVRTYAKWTTIRVEIGRLPPGYQIKISGKGLPNSATTPFADMEIDNIQFVNCQDDTVLFVTDISCTFENGTCGWIDYGLSTNSKLDWTRTNSPEVDPGYDHTSRVRPTPAQYGNWLTTRREPGMTGNNTATLMTVKQLPASGTKCLTFWYHMFGRDPATFALVLNEQMSEIGGAILWVKKLPQSNNWMKAQVNVQNNKPYYLMFRATLQSQMSTLQDTIGLDDITFTDGNCPDTPFCDFEANFCGWTSDNNDWIRTTMNGSAVKFPTGDHTLEIDYGTYVKVKNPNRWAYLSYKFNDTTPLNNSMPSPKRSMCVKFWYYYATVNSQNLSLVVNSNHFQPTNTTINTTYWTSNPLNSIQKQWLYARANISVYNGDLIRFKTLLNDNNSVIAIDDVLLENHPCEPMGWCDFESDFCGWTNAPQQPNVNRILWLRNSGSTASANSGPKRDHTTDSTEGWYAFVPLDSQEKGAAILQSEPLDYGPVVCLKFFYHIKADNSVYSPKLIVMTKTIQQINPVPAMVIRSQFNDVWTPINITLNNTSPNFRIWLRSVEGNMSRSDVAVDDIQISRGACGQPSIPITKTPTTTTPIPANEKQWDCNFESDNCMWTTDQSWNKTRWISGVSQFGPRVDHTLKTANGHYLLLTPHPNFISPAQIQSSLIQVTGNPHCLSLWYYSDSESYFNISIGYIIPNGGIDLVNRVFLLTPTMVSNTWKQIKTQLPLVPNIAITVRLNYNKAIVGGFAIDDITITPGMCPIRSGEICDFSYNYCGYEVTREAPPTGGIGIGLLVNAQTLHDFNLIGPLNDHTTKNTGNYFLFTNQVNDINGLYKTQLVINHLPKTYAMTGSCLKFWYQIKGDYSSSFYIYVVPVNTYTYNNPQWRANYPNHTTWTMGQLTVNADYEHKIVFSLAQMKNALSYIALDDISISDGSCEPPISCDFDTDSCSWHDIDNLTLSNWNWGRFTGPPVDNTWPGPMLDHTINRYGGSYLYLTNYRQSPQIKSDRNAFIESMTVPVNGSKCFSYWTQLLGNDTSIQVSIVKYGKSIDPKNQIQTLSKFNGTLKRWTKVEVNINPNILIGVSEFSIRIRGIFNNPTSFIALDDVQLTDGVCKTSALDAFQCSDGTQLDISKVCNFVNDCPQKDDELNCGACDFETDTCGWTNSSKDGRWLRKSAFDQFEPPIGPKTDGKNNMSGHYLIFKKAEKWTLSIVQSNINDVYRLKRAHMLCTMTFDYYMKSNATLRVRIMSGVSSVNYVWRMTGDQGSAWKTADVSIYQQRAPFTIQFVGLSFDQLAVIAIDDISFKNCAPEPSATTECPINYVKCPNNNVCIYKYTLCDGTDDCGDEWDESIANCQKITVPKCQFETTNINCQWTHETDVGSKADWFYVKSGSNLDRMTGPVTDHTYRRMRMGYFLALNGSAADFDKKSRIITSWVQTSPGRICALRLFYYMFGNNLQMGSLHIYPRFLNQMTGTQNSLFSITGNRGQHWFRATAPVTDPRPFQFVIEGQVGRGNLADIAIDDVSFSDGCVKAIPIIPPTTPTIPIITTKPPIIITSKSSTAQITNNPTIGIPSQFTRNLSITTTKSSTITNKLTSKTIPTIKPRITTTIQPKTTQHSNLKGNTDPEKSGPNTGGIVAAVLVPIFVIAIIIGVWFYRRHRIRQSEDDRRRLLHDDSSLAVINLTEVNRNDHEEK